MKKKEYKKPEMQVIELQHTTKLLTGSNPEPEWYPGPLD